jgi:hypothetical protein
MLKRKLLSVKLRLCKKDQRVLLRGEGGGAVSGSRDQLHGVILFMPFTPLINLPSRLFVLFTQNSECTV